MIRKLLFGACIGGLIIGQVYEAPLEQQAKEAKLWQNTQSSNDTTRARAEGELLKLAKNKGISNSSEAEAIYKQILAINPNSAPAHTRLAEIQLKRWSTTKNPIDKESGLNHLSKAKELYKQYKVDFYVQKLEKVEAQVNKGTPGYAWDFPQL
ncbi:hypothetical protein [Iningainema tapete]|uniref:Tetratricopeptide repeat protein n=1 Tax=Iningainema tapete BLCC-T55 TaxID=2748662 RepID=A0A8J6XM81_9CYAN|nr:hypothetical protein [Iningainema tapete]MBD2774304.1 hypothetical protein [Iningainema tapete BLCC-T55]